jgi:predicted Zn-dependent protease
VLDNVVCGRPISVRVECRLEATHVGDVFSQCLPTSELCSVASRQHHNIDIKFVPNYQCVSKRSHQVAGTIQSASTVYTETYFVSTMHDW